MRIEKRRCRKIDYNFVYRVTKETLFPIIQKYLKPDKKKFDEGFFSTYRETMILLRGKRRIGFYQLEISDDSIHIMKLFLSPAYHRKGIGKELMNYFETLKSKKITLQVWDNNPAYNFYRKLGYKKVRVKNHKIFMEKILH